MRKTVQGFLCLAALATACGAAPAPKTNQPAPTVAAAGAGSAEPGAQPACETPPPVPVPEAAASPCDRPAANAREAWKRIELARGLPEGERKGSCGLGFVAAVARFRTVPQDLLLPIVLRAVADRAGFDAWMKAAADRAPEALAQVAAMDIARRFEVGNDPSVVTTAASEWKKRLAELRADGKLAAAGIDGVLSGADALAALLARVNEVYRLRCLLDVNPLGFAVACKPIHPAGTPVTLSWKTATRDGLIESLELEECKGKSCTALKAGAGKLLDAYLALVKDAEQLKMQVYADRVKALLVLPPLRNAGPG
ncbi:MAG: hypothetical protein PHU25_10160 [Deltaproteobacteria bacterium]|nr:hypothetical protein [Deltaproteobacteria bacterium]